MKTGSAIIVAFMSAIVIFGVAKWPGDSLDVVTVHATNDQQRQNEQKKKEAPAQKKQNEDDATVRLDTTLVTVPVVAMDRAGKFVPGLTKEDFRIYEEGVETVKIKVRVERPNVAVRARASYVYYPQNADK